MRSRHRGNSPIGKTNRVTHGLCASTDFAKYFSSFGVEREYSPFKQRHDLPRHSQLQRQPTAALWEDFDASKQFGQTHRGEVSRFGGLPIQPVQHGLCRHGLEPNALAIRHPHFRRISLDRAASKAEFKSLIRWAIAGDPLVI